MGFSAASRRRLIHLMASVNEDRTGPDRYFVTLTYPRTFPACAGEWKRHLRAFVKRLLRVGVAAVIWKLEPQQRGAPHFHLLVFDSPAEQRPPVDGQGERDPELGTLRRWVAGAWCEIVDSRGATRVDHLRAGTQVQRIKSWAGVNHYTAKYVAKVQTVPRDLAGVWLRAGRFWGKSGHLVIDPVTRDLAPAAFFAVRRQLRRLMSKKLGRKVRTWGVNGLSTFLAAGDALRLASKVDERGFFS